MMLEETMIKPNMVMRCQLATGLNLSTTMAFYSFNLQVRTQADQRKNSKRRCQERSKITSEVL